MNVLKMFARSADVDSLLGEIKDLKSDKRKLIEELEDLKLKKRLEQEEIKHMVKLNDEKNAIEIERKKTELEKKSAEEMTKFRDQQRVLLVDSLKEFHAKIESRFSSELGNLKEVYNVLIEKLPNVNFNIEKRIAARHER